jgi:hypothetical protein
MNKPVLAFILLAAFAMVTPASAQVIMELGTTEFTYDPATGQPTSDYSADVLVSGAAEPVFGISWQAMAEFSGFNHTAALNPICNINNNSGDRKASQAASLGFDISTGVFSNAEFVEVSEEHTYCLNGSSINVFRRSIRVAIVDTMQGPFTGQILDVQVPIGTLTIQLSNASLSNDLDGASVTFLNGSYFQPSAPDEVTYISGNAESHSSIAGQTFNWVRSNSFRRGHFEAPFILTISDPLRVILYLFGGGVAPECQDSVDSNDDGLINLSDPVLVLTYLFASGPQPSDPFSQCGSDLTVDSLDCAVDLCQ